MKKEGKVQNFVIALFGIAIVAMSIGFAAYTTTLTIGGTSGNGATATFTPTTWNVHYDTAQANRTINTATGYVAPTTITVSETDITFDVTLSRPGDKCEFTVPVLNEGSFDAYLNAITMTVNGGTTIPEFVDYRLTYNNQTYTASTPTIDNEMLPNKDQNPTNYTKNLTVYVEYKLPATTAGLPTNQNKTVTFGASLKFDDTDTPA